MKQRFHNILSWFAFLSLFLGVLLWGSVLTNQYLNPEPKYLFKLSCFDDEDRVRLEQIAAITEQKGGLFWESYAEKGNYALSEFTDWDTLVPRDPCASGDPFGLSRIVEFEGTLYFVDLPLFDSWDEEYALRIPDYNPLKRRDEIDRMDFGILSLIVWGVSVTLNYLLFGVFRIMPWWRGGSADE